MFANVLVLLHLHVLQQNYFRHLLYDILIGLFLTSRQAGSLLAHIFAVTRLKMCGNNLFLFNVTVDLNLQTSVSK